MAYGGLVDAPRECTPGCQGPIQALRTAARAALGRYRVSRARGIAGRLLHTMLGRPGCLARLSDALAGHRVVRRRDAGYLWVAAEDIRGGTGRADEFDAQFHPLCSENADRWFGIAASRLLQHSLPPVRLVQVGDAYYVCDGHHRVSVARALGERTILAHVTVLDLDRT